MSDSSTRNRQDLPGQTMYQDDTYFTTFTVGDVKSIYNIAASNDERQLAAIIDKHINRKVNDLTLHDFNFCMYWHRINSYPRSPMRINWNCPHCTQANSSPLENASLVINNVDREYFHGIEVPLPSLENPIGMRLQLVGDDQAARLFLRDKKRLFTPSTGQLREGLMALLISPSYPEIDKAYDAITKEFYPDDLFMIQTFEETFAYGVQEFASFKCKSCGRESSVNFTFNLTSFFPQDHDRRDLRDKILSLRQAKSKPDEPGQSGIRGSGLDDAEIREETDGSRGEKKTRGNGKELEIESSQSHATAAKHDTNDKIAKPNDANQPRTVSIPLADILQERPDFSGEGQRAKERLTK